MADAQANATVRDQDRPAPTLTSRGYASGGMRWQPDYISPPEGGGGKGWPYSRPATTIVGSFKPEIVAAPGYRTTVSRQNAPGSVRITAQEAAILQSFPPDFPWQGSKTKQFQQIGNAVPPLLAEAVLKSATRYVRGGV